ncbi:MAG: hypothetical protein AB7G13_26905 [Lautropia sp.]
MREVKKNAACPCKSGQRYGACCKKKAFKWHVDEDGEFHRQVPLNSEAIEALEGAKAKFLEVFGREPRGSDPLFVWKYLVNEEEIERQAIEVMRKADLRPELIYAYQKTGGLLISRENAKLVTGKDLQDWDDAIDEYFAIRDNASDVHPVPILLDALARELESCIICLGYVIECGQSSNASPIGSSSELFSSDDYALICATKAMKTLRSEPPRESRRPVGLSQACTSVASLASCR